MSRIIESNRKVEAVRKKLAELDVNAVVIRKQCNFSWITAGGRGFIGLASENACGCIVVSKDAVYLFANNIEAPRLANEELPEGFAQVVSTLWENDGTLNQLIADKVGTFVEDSALEPFFKEQRTLLCEEEIQRYRVLAKETVEVVEQVCRELPQGATEVEIAGMLAQGFWKRAIEPITLLVAADDRSNHVRHYVPTEKKVQKGVILSVCARRHGLIVSATRIVAFDKAFAAGYRNLLKVEADMFDSIKAGNRISDVFAAGCASYASNGLPEEWQNHHQGGLTGYVAREIRADHSTGTEILVNQAYAFNPSVKGAKCEDTVLVTEQGLEFLTDPTAQWPCIQQSGYRRADVLCR
ncbi:M24 family metallopeptidase [Oscillospiraceae bacterium MB08-C2-2]|nr:M24 family metallopeptidase [Oscillospiraceae bacterium MB08-C2-2]